MQRILDNYAEYICCIQPEVGYVRARGVRIARSICPAILRIILLFEKREISLSKEATHFLLRIGFKFVILVKSPSSGRAVVSGR